MDNILQVMEQDRFAKYVGVEIVSASNGQAEGWLNLQEYHLNSLGIAQGGAIFTLADTTFAAASNSREGTAVASNVTITFCKPASSGKLIAKAKEVSLNRRLATYIIEVFDESDNTIALFQGTVYRKVQNDKH